MGVLNELYSFRNYINEAVSKSLSTSEILLWYILKLFQSDENELIYVPGYTLEKCTGLSHKGFYKARQKLIEKGYIEYIPDKLVNKSGSYRFIINFNSGVHTKLTDNNMLSEKVHTGVHTEPTDSNKLSEKVHTGVHTEPMNSNKLSEKVHTGVHTEPTDSNKLSEKVHTGVHTEPTDSNKLSEKVHTEVHAEPADNNKIKDKVHTENIDDSDYKKLFGIEDDVLKVNGFSKASKMFKRMINE